MKKSKNLIDLNHVRGASDPALLSLLESAFTFHSVSGKNQDFVSSISRQPFFFNRNSASDPDLPHIHAGGSISYSAPVTFRMSALPYLLLFFVTDGKGRLLFSESNLPLVGGTLLLIPAQTELCFQTDQTPFSYCLYIIEGKTLTPYLTRLIDTDGACACFAAEAGTSDYLCSHMRQIDHLLETGEEDSEFYIANFLQNVLTECIQLSLPKDQREFSLPKHVQYMKRRFEQDYFENHSLESLEEETGISKYRLCHDFSKYMQVPPIRYLNRVRIAQAKLLLEQTNRTVHEIGEEVGIPNTSHFVRLFEKIVGISPAGYRQSHTHFL